jgi:2-methylcitrate dehydratase PrpD
MCAGLETPHSLAAQRAVRAWGGTAESTVVGRGWRLPAPQAAFLNAFHARAHTFDDTHTAGPIHPGSSVVSAALACAEATGASGARLLAAVAAGYEVATRLSLAVSPSHYDAGFHNTGTCNTLGACASAGRVLGLGPIAMAEAFGLAGGGAAGLREYQVDGSMADTSLDGARAAQTGVTAAQLRVAGMVGPRRILDGPWGFCRVLAPHADPSMLDHGLGDSFVCADTAIKPFPSCRCTHGPVEVLLGMRRTHGIAAAHIETITIDACRPSVEISDRPEAHDRFRAILSHQYCAAVALLSGGLTLEDFDDARLRDPAVQALAAKVRVRHNPAFDAWLPGRWAHRVRVVLRDGRAVEVDSDDAPGGSANPLAPEFIVEKFRRLAVPVLGPEQTDALRRAVDTLEHLPDAGALARLLTSCTSVSAVSDGANPN